MARGDRGTDRSTGLGVRGVWVETSPPGEGADDAFNDRKGVLCVGDGKEAEE